MTEPNPEFDATHPSGHVVFRSCRGGYLHSVALGEATLDADPESLACAALSRRLRSARCRRCGPKSWRPVTPPPMRCPARPISMRRYSG